MKAEDTVVKIEDIQDLWIPCETCHREPFWKTGDSPIECMECIGLKHREYQAEISFKAGFNEALNTVVATREYDAGKEAGRKEVVEWLRENDGEPDYILDKWEAQLKDWGIN